MKIRFQFLIACIIGSLLLLNSCGSDKEEACVFIPPVKEKISVDYLSLADSVAQLETKEEVIDFLGRHPVIRDNFLRRHLYPNDAEFIEDLSKRFTNNYMDTLRADVKRVFGDEQELKKQFEEAFSNLKYYYPDFVAPKIITLITGLDNDMVMSDSLIIISLDYFIGPGAKFRPNMYDYLLRQYTKDNIVPSVMLLYGMNWFNYSNPEDETTLADMVAYGKAYYFAKHTLPCVADSIFIWYTTEEIKGAKSNHDLIWYRFIEDQVLYSTSHVTKQKFLSERPVTIEVGEKCPGRIGQWVGWEIVKSYMKAHPETTLPQLMEMADADKLFKESRYKPVRK
ncbi:MAG: gliding motility lipoprotein GldB [Cyclobacteriaceae bacterium]|nr:gliding motility lipoprotein GldB [Cyclobacteriaceae bacterium]